MVRLSLAFLVLVASTASAEDWPQWRGPNRTGISKEKGLLKTWPKEGPKLLWQVGNLGGGYSTPSIADGVIYGMSYQGNEEVVWALQEADGSTLWTTRIAGKGNTSYNEGPRSTPTVHDGLVYAVGISGDLACLNARTGKLVWTKNLPKHFQGRVGGWAYSESPAIDGDKVIVTPGGKQAAVVALHRKTGETIWRAAVPEDTEAHYASAIVETIAGVKQVVQFLSNGVYGFDAATGKFLWRYDAPANSTANCSTPIVVGTNSIFAASNYGTGGGLTTITKTGTGFNARQVYFTKSMQNHHGGMVLVNGFLYGENSGRLACIDIKTGKPMWDEREPGKGSITYADGKLYYRNEGGRMWLIAADPKKFTILGRFEQPDRSDHNAWPHPVVVNGKLYLRDQDKLFCYAVK